MTRYFFDPLAASRGALAAVALLSAGCFGSHDRDAIASSAGGGQESDTGMNALALAVEFELAPGVALRELRYAIVGHGSTKEGVVPVSGARISFAVGGLAAGGEYRADLRAVSIDDKIACMGSAPFAITAGKTASVSVHLSCRLQRTGGVRIDGTLDICPSIDLVTIAPPVAAVGMSIRLDVSARDPDDVALAFSWLASTGSVASGAPGSASYVCRSRGNPTITVLVSDGVCEESTSFPVTCEDPGAGDAGRDARADGAPLVDGRAKDEADHDARDRVPPDGAEDGGTPRDEGGGVEGDARADREDARADGARGERDGDADGESGAAEDTGPP